MRRFLPARRQWLLIGVFLFGFLFLTPLGRFADWIPPERHTGFYSLTDIDISDEGGKYVYIASLWFDGDLDFSNNWQANVQAFTATATGVARNYWTIGPALLWFPFFWVGRGLSLAYARAGLLLSLDGYDFPELTVTGISTILYAFLGLLCLAQALRRVTSDRAAFWIALAAWLSSLVPFYTFVQTKMDHGLETAAVSLVLLCLLRAREAPERTARWLALGAATGLAATVRLNTVLVLTVVAGLFLRTLCPGGFRPRPCRPAAEAWASLLRQGGAWLAGFLPLYATQMLAAWTFFGRPFGPSGDPAYSADAVLSPAGWGRLLEPAAYLEILLGPRYGILPGMPLVLPAAMGLWARFRRRETLAGAVLVYLGLLLAMMVMFNHWGNGYGYRYVSGALPFLALGLADFHERTVRPRGWTGRAAVAAALAVAWQYLQILQHKTWMAHDDPEFTWRAFTNVPEILLEPAALLRSSAWLPLALQDGLRLETVADVHYVILLPALLLALLAAGAVAWNACGGGAERNAGAATGSTPSDRADRFAPWAVGALALAVSPVLWIGLHPPRPTGHALYASLLAKVKACLAAPPVYRHALPDLVGRARALGAELERPDPRLDILWGRLLIDGGNDAEGRRVLAEAAARFPERRAEIEAILNAPSR